MNYLAKLLCGGNSEGSAKIALNQLSSSIEIFSEKAQSYLSQEITDEALKFGPFCARVLLENGCAALVGRLDAFRLMYLCEFQSQEQYEPGKRAKSAFAWTGDVMTEEKPNQALWHIDHNTTSISRALFSKYSDHIIWKPAFNNLLDHVSNLDNDAILSEILSIDPDRFIDESKGRAAQLYSTLSKGVHWEFFTSALLFDEPTVKSSIQETLILISKLGLASHFAHTAYASLPHAEAIDYYKEFRKLVP